MHKSILRMELFSGSMGSTAYRTIFTTQHGRRIFLALTLNGSICTISDCFYIDRNQGREGQARYSSRPKNLLTLQFPIDDLLSVIESELDKKFYGVEFEQTDLFGLTLDEYLHAQIDRTTKKYSFLIMLGTGEDYNGLPKLLRTRLKNNLHRSVYVELAYYKDGNGVVKQCYYYDRKYQRQEVKITPPMLISCFFPYTKDGILNLLNNEICCAFSHIIITNGIDIDSNTMPLCGAL